MSKEVMQQALWALESSRVFVTSREKIRHPEGTEWYDKRIEALRTALAQPDPSECSRSHPHENMGSHCQLRTEIARLTNENARLKAQPESEPVAWLRPIFMIEDGWDEFGFTKSSDEDVPLYTAPHRKWVGLTDEERQEIYDCSGSVYGVMKEAEAKLKEKNT